MPLVNVSWSVPCSTGLAKSAPKRGMRMIAKASPNGTFVRVARGTVGSAAPRSARFAGPKPFSRAWTVTACSLLAATSVHQSCQVTNSNNNSPRVTSTSPRVRTAQRNPFIVVPSSLSSRVLQTQASRVCRKCRLVDAFHAIAQSEHAGVLAVDRDLLTLVQRGAHGRLVTDRLDDVWR